MQWKNTVGTRTYDRLCAFLRKAHRVLRSKRKSIHAHGINLQPEQFACFFNDANSTYVDKSADVIEGEFRPMFSCQTEGQAAVSGCDVFPNLEAHKTRSQRVNEEASEA